MRHIALAMFRPTLDDIPIVAPPEGYRIRRAVEGDEANWVRIEVAAGEFMQVEAAQARVASTFPDGIANHPRDTCYFLETDDGLAIATTTASQDTFEGEHRGQVSWVGMLPEFQGRGLSNALLSTVLRDLAERYNTAFLVTQTTSYPAIGLYSKFGFLPTLRRPECPEGWRLVEEALGRTLPAPVTSRDAKGVS